MMTRGVILLLICLKVNLSGGFIHIPNSRLGFGSKSCFRLLRTADWPVDRKRCRRYCSTLWTNCRWLCWTPLCRKSRKNRSTRTASQLDSISRNNMHWNDEMFVNCWNSARKTTNLLGADGSSFWKRWRSEHFVLPNFASSLTSSPLLEKALFW